MLLKITEKIIRKNAFEQKKKKPGLSTCRPSNNWALNVILTCNINLNDNIIQNNDT